MKPQKLPTRHMNAPELFKAVRCSNEKTDAHHAGPWWFSNLMLQDVALRVDNADNASRQPTRHCSAAFFFISKIYTRKTHTHPRGFFFRIMIFCSRFQTTNSKLAKNCSSTHPDPPIPAKPAYGLLIEDQDLHSRDSVHHGLPRMAKIDHQG